MAAIGWGVLIPVGIVMARSFKEAAPLWFHLHRGLQVGVTRLLLRCVLPPHLSLTGMQSPHRF